MTDMEPQGGERAVSHAPLTAHHVLYSIKPRGTGGRSEPTLPRTDRPKIEHHKPRDFSNKSDKSIVINLIATNRHIILSSCILEIGKLASVGSLLQDMMVLILFL